MSIDFDLVASFSIPPFLSSPPDMTHWGSWFISYACSLAQVVFYHSIDINNQIINTWFIVIVVIIYLLQLILPWDTELMTNLMGICSHSHLHDMNFPELFSYICNAPHIFSLFFFSKSNINIILSHLKVIKSAKYQFIFHHHHRYRHRRWCQMTILYTWIANEIIKNCFYELRLIIVIIIMICHEKSAHDNYVYTDFHDRR